MSSEINYYQRIQSAIDYIRENIHKPITLEEVSRASGLSKFHFHRIFRFFMNESLGSYITRKKLESAAIKLAYNPGMKISDLAERYGYSSASNFSKAFVNWFGLRPSEIRSNQGGNNGKFSRLKSRHGKDFNVNELFVMPAIHDFDSKFNKIDKNVRIVNTGDVCLQCLTSEGGYDFLSIQKTWQELIGRAQDFGIGPDAFDRFAISHDHPGMAPEGLCRYDACIHLHNRMDVKLPFLEARIPAGRYAVYSCSGPEESILGQYLEFFSVWMPESGYVSDTPPIYENYLPDCRPGNLSTDLWVRIKYSK